MKDSTKIDKSLQQFFKNNPQGFVVFDDAYRFLLVNPSFCEMIGYTEQELNNLTMSDIIHLDDIEEMRQLAQQLFTDKISSFAFEQQWAKKNGEMLWLNLVISAIRDKGDSLSCGVAMVEDITRHKQTEESYRHLRERMGQTEQLATLGRLTSTVTHEINNALHVVQGLLNLSLEEMDNPVDLVQYLNMSLTESTKVVELIRRLRYSYRGESEPVTDFELNPLLEEVATLAHRELKRKNVGVHTHLASNLPSITSRFSQLYLIFLSLTLNLGEALWMTGKGEIEIQSDLLSQGVVVRLLGKGDKADLDVAKLNLSLSFSRDKIVELDGRFSIDKQSEGIVCVVEIPFSIPETSSSI